MELNIIDTVDHLLVCNRMGEIPNSDPDLVEFLVKLATRAYMPNPGLPIPNRLPYELEIELDMDLEVEPGGTAAPDNPDQDEMSLDEFSGDSE